VSWPSYGGYQTFLIRHNYLSLGFKSYSAQFTTQSNQSISPKKKNFSYSSSSKKERKKENQIIMMHQIQFSSHKHYSLAHMDFVSSLDMYEHIIKPPGLWGNLSEQ
jgi:hypothetical protein